MRITSFGDLAAFVLLAIGLGLSVFSAYSTGEVGTATLASAAGLALLVWRFSPLHRRPKIADAVDVLGGPSLGPTSERNSRPVRHEAKPEADAGSSPSDRLVRTMIGQGREVLLLRPQIATNLNAEQLQQAQNRLDEVMAIVPQGPVVLLPWETDRDYPEDGATELVEIEGFYLDRYPVTNRQYKEFVDADGYEQMSLWDEEIWPAVLEFVDQTGHPGPRFWQDGDFPRGLADHPVVGVSWYEASAFARWVGKRLPTDPEWVKSGAWPVSTDNGLPTQRRFPWGESMDRTKAHLWGPTVDSTTPVTATPDGASVGGIHQLIGNVWEWTSSPFAAWDQGTRFFHEKPLKSVRGGAFDTYFDCQASCQFQSGEDPLARKHNVGFRCAVGVCDVEPVGWETPEELDVPQPEPAPEKILP